MKNHNSKIKSVVSLLIVAMTLIGMIPTTFAAQSNEYVDPADSWLETNNRANEFDANATVTSGTQFCHVCLKDTLSVSYRVPEYTKTGETALNRGVRYSDGTCMDGVSKGNLDDGSPGKDAFYTGSHWTKAICQICGTLNQSDKNDYCFNNNVYSLNPCDHNFFLDFDATSHVPHDESQHMTTLKKGEYCKFCKGTFAKATKVLEIHNFTKSVDGQIGNNRFYIAEYCEDCGYETNEYVVAKSVVTSYYGEADGEAHTLEVSDLSESGVSTRIRYGTEAGNCNRTSAPNYTQPGYYTVYYEIDYSYAGEVMTENGVSYVWLLAAEEEDEGEDSSGNIIVIPPAHEHDYHYLETVNPTCDTLGYDRFQCNGCGDLIKTNYNQSLGHQYKEIEIREATCKQNGLVLHMCKECGDFYEESTALGNHAYEKYTHDATCKSVGYDEYTCSVCGDNYINNIKPMVEHRYRQLVRKADCETDGYTNNICEMCNISFVSDHVDALGHAWDEGTEVTGSTCTGEGVIEHSCTNEGCKEKMIIASDATGHTPGDAATCTEPQICTVCETVLELPTGHTYTSKVTDATCTSSGYTTHFCDNCSHSYIDSYTDVLDHDYEETVTEPTCTAMGYTTYSCRDCDAEHVGDYTDKLKHNYIETKTPATCTEFGYSTFVCEPCGDTYVGNYVDKLDHEYSGVTTPPSCIEDGFTVYTCDHCDNEYIADYTDEIEHDYEEIVVPATCTEMGYTIFTCAACGDTYNGNYTDKIAHDHVDTVTEAGCTTLGYTEYVCSVCGDTYKGDYKEPKGHTPTEWIVDAPATIESEGSKHIECEACGETLQTGVLAQLIGKDNTDEDGKAQVGDYSLILLDENTKPIFNSEIAIDVNDSVSILLTNDRLLNYEKPTTIIAFYTETQEPKEALAINITDSRGNKATGATDTEGKLVVPNNKTNTGDDNGTIGKDDNDAKETFVITITDKYNVVISNCEVYIGESNNVVIDLPDGIKPTREEPIIVTVLDHEGNPQEGVTIIAFGDSDFVEKGATDLYGKITMPTASDGYTDEDGKVNVNEINVIVSDETAVIPDAYVVYNEDGTISVTLPEGKTIVHSNRVTVQIINSIGEPVEGTTVTVKDGLEVRFTGVSNTNGKVFVPPLSEDYTDSEGKAVVNEINVVITDEAKAIENAFVVIAENQINITLPETAVFDYHNRIIATLTDKDGNPVKDIAVTFVDGNGNTEVVVSDENGKAIVPPVHKDMTDSEGRAKVNGYNVVIADENAPIANAFIEIIDGKISIVLPETSVLELANRISVTVTDSEDKPVKDMSVTVKDKTERTETNLTNEQGKAIVPPTNIDETDVNGYGELNEYSVTVKRAETFIEKAFIEIDEANAIKVTLPAGIYADYNSRITVEVANKADKTPVKDISVTVVEVLPEPETEGTETDGEVEEETPSTETTASENTEETEPEAVYVPKTYTAKTDRIGKVVFPALNEDITDNEGGSGVTDTDEEEGKDTDGDGQVDQPGEVVETVYNVGLKDTKGNIEGAIVKVEDGKIYITLPETHTLTTSNQVTATVTDKDGKAVQGVVVTITDKTNTSKNGTTNASGQVTLPVKSSGGGGGSSYSGGGGGGGGYYSSTTVKVVDQDGKTVSVTRSVTSTKATLTLPTGKKLTDGSNYTITVTSGGKPKADYEVILKDKDKNEATAKTDKNGVVILPAKEHFAYIVGYPDGTFKPEGDMIRAEAAAIFARLISEEKGESISGKSTFKDIDAKKWYASYIGYLEKYDVIKGYTDGTFKPEAPVTRAEFVAMTVRYYDIFNEVTTVTNTTKYTDVAGTYWATQPISFATSKKWLNGYADGTFKPDINISRSEVVTVVNRATGRNADEEYIKSNYTTLDRFIDVNNSSYWAWADIMEAANEHLAVETADSEIWVD